MEELLKAIAVSNNEQKISLLPQLLEYGESGIDYLLECLEDPGLEIRAKAYELLQSVKTDKVKKAIANRLLLNPGDRVYSVYEAGKWYTDTVYLLCDGVNDIEDIYIQVYGRENFGEDDEMLRSKRIFCFVDKNQAKRIAELIHRDCIKKNGISIGGFEWRKKNYNFDAKKWCINNNILYQEEWNKLDEYQTIYKIKEVIYDCQDLVLDENLRRSRYTYHLKHIETWFKDNQLDYDYSLDNWDNLEILLEYLRSPENIELLSKFWKDGVGHFAFVREEIARQKLYLKIGEKLSDQTFVAKPENYDRQVSNYLIEIVNDDRKKAKYRLKAYELLKNFDTPEAKKAIARGIDDIEVESIFDLGDEIELNAIRNSWDGNPT